MVGNLYIHLHLDQLSIFFLLAFYFYMHSSFLRSSLFNANKNLNQRLHAALCESVIQIASTAWKCHRISLTDCICFVLVPESLCLSTAVEVQERLAKMKAWSSVRGYCNAFVHSAAFWPTNTGRIRAVVVGRNFQNTVATYQVPHKRIWDKRLTQCFLEAAKCQEGQGLISETFMYACIYFDMRNSTWSICTALHYGLGADTGMKTKKTPWPNLSSSLKLLQHS